MDRFDLLIHRTQSFSKSIGGELYVNLKRIAYTLELPWRWNAKNVSCIPPGRYSAFIRYDKPDGWRIQLIGVPGNRTGVQIHIGNYPRHVQGCILVGRRLSQNAVFDSKLAYEELRALFYGRSTRPVVATPDKVITVAFDGILATPWGDYPEPKPAITRTV